MATTNALGSLRPADAIPEGGNAPAAGEYGLVPVGSTLKGVGFAAGVDSAANFVVIFPATASFGTGLTVALSLMTDPNNIAPASGDVKFEITVKRLATVTQPGSWATLDGATAVTGTQTIGVAGIPVLKSIAVAAASLGTAVAASTAAVIRVRRLGTDAADTHKGRVLLLGALLTDT